MSKIKPTSKVKHLIKLVEENGWSFDRMKGSHRHFKHREKDGLVTIPGKLSLDVKRGTRNSILRQAGLK